MITYFLSIINLLAYPELTYFFLMARYTYSGKLIHLAVDLFNDYDTYIA